MKSQLARTRWRILIVDDHPITRYGLAQLIGREPDLQVCGEAEDARHAMAALKSARPNLVLADVTMPGRSGLELIKDLQALQPDLPVLVMSMHDETLYAERVLRAGARGYIMKSEGGEKLLGAIRQVLQGHLYVSKPMANLLLGGLVKRRPGVAEAGLAALTDREFEIFQVIGQGHSAREISRRLGISVKTVATHRMHIIQKLRLDTSGELARHAARWAAAQQIL